MKKPGILVLAGLLVLAGCSQTQEDSIQLVGEYELSPSIQQGTILHAWSWDFNTIRENLPYIAQAGFSAVQTSPIVEIIVGEDGGMQLQDSADSKNNGKWYYQYQPVSYQIGNYQLGTEEEFKALCEEAEKYDIKIIVDAVLNHMTSDRDSISEEVLALSDEPFHENGGIEDWSSREQVTQNDLLGLADLNTQDEAIQQAALDFLQRAVEDGADGFRYDAAIHIELPDDEESYASDFWTVVLDNGSEFQYGEVLQGASSRDSAYAGLMSVTASDYGETLRDALKKRSLEAKFLTDFKVDADADSIVTWVESHDNYCNDGSWASLSEWQTIQGWAIIAARDGGTPLFFSRPNHSSQDDQWGDNQIGARGSDAFMSTEVTEINRFHNQMIGLEETISNPMSTKILMIERGDAGAILVSVSRDDTELDAETVLKDGTYTDHISGSEFTVKDGRLTGTMPADGIVVLY